jgi:hypothetical protein
MKAFVLFSLTTILSVFSYAGPSVSGSPMNGPRAVCAQKFQRGLWIYPVGFQVDKFEGYYINNGSSVGPFECKYVNQAPVIWDCYTMNPRQNGASAQIYVDRNGKSAMQFFARDRVESPRPADTVVCDAH